LTPFARGPRSRGHVGSGLSLTGGAKTVRLTNLVIDPGRSVLTGASPWTARPRPTSRRSSSSTADAEAAAGQSERHRGPAGHDGHAEAEAAAIGVATITVNTK
jgi:hypothetical protein